MGGFIFLAAPSLVAHTAEGHLTMTCAAAWIPWALLAYERLRRGRPFSVVMLAAVMALAFFAGHAQTVYYLALALGSFVIIDVARGFLAARTDAVDPTATAKRDSLDPTALIVRFALAGMLTAGLVAVDLLPIWLTSQQTTRVQQGLSASQASEMGATLVNLQQLANPFAARQARHASRGQQLLGNVALRGDRAAIAGDLRRVRLLANVSDGSLQRTVCRGVDLFAERVDCQSMVGFINYLPGLATFRVPSRAMLFGSAAVSVLAAIGLQQLFHWHAQVKEMPKAWRTASIVAARLLAAVVAFELAWHAVAITRTASMDQLQPHLPVAEAWTISAAEYRVLAAHDLLSDGQTYKHSIARVRGYDPFLLRQYAGLLEAALGNRPFLARRSAGLHDRSEFAIRPSGAADARCAFRRALAPRHAIGQAAGKLPTNYTALAARPTACRQQRRRSTKTKVRCRARSSSAGRSQAAICRRSIRRLRFSFPRTRRPAMYSNLSRLRKSSRMNRRTSSSKRN